MSASRVIPVTPPPVVKHRGDFFRDGFASMVVIGKSGCGKTMMLASVLDSLSDGIKTFIVATAAHTRFHDDIIKWFKEKRGCLAAKVTDPTELRTALDVMYEEGIVSPTRPGAILFDDFNIGNLSAHCPYNRVITHCFTKLRNEGWHFVIVAQQPSLIPTAVRNCTTSRVLFDCYTKSALQSFTKDLVHRLPPQYAQHVINRLLQYIHDVRYTYLHVQENPFTISAGKLDKRVEVVRDQDVRFPTLAALEKEMGASNREELRSAARDAQVEAGNTAPQLHRRGV